MSTPGVPDGHEGSSTEHHPVRHEQHPNQQDQQHQDQPPQDQPPQDQQDEQHQTDRLTDRAPDRATTEGPDMTATTLSRPPVSSNALTLLDRSASGLLQACAARTAGERYVAAHLAALRAAAAVLAVRGRSSRGGPRSVWELVPRVAPELSEWASFFEATAGRRAAIESGRASAVTPREADDLLRDAETFQHVVEGILGLPQYPVLPEALPTCT
ncbi:MAG: SAV_6107 family HEPN domain-containing protein [Kineosporiaceae bacterium]